MTCYDGSSATKMTQCCSNQKDVCNLSLLSVKSNFALTNAVL